MDRFENGMLGTNGSSIETHKIFPMHYGLWGEKIQSLFQNVYIAINGIKLIHGIHIHKSTLLTKNSTNAISIL